MKKNNNFSYFTDKNNPEAKRKDFLKKIWKITKIIFYLFVFSLTMTGCVQSFVIKNSNYVGSGVEFYNNKEEISPYVNTLESNKIKEDLNILDKEGNATENKKEIVLDVLKPNKDVNVLVNDEKTLEGAHKQIDRTGGSISEAKVYVSSFSLKNINPEKLTQLGYDQKVSDNYNLIRKNDNLLLRVENSKTYEYINDITDIYLISFLQNSDAKYLELKTLENDSKKLFITDESKFVIKKSSGLDIVSKIEPFSLEILKNNPDKEKEAINLANAAFARDVLQTFFNYSFGKESDFVKSLNQETNKEWNSFSDYIKDLNTKIKEAESNNTSVEISQVEYRLITIYQETIFDWLISLGFLSKRNKDQQSVTNSLFRLDDPAKYDGRIIVDNNNINTKQLKINLTNASDNPFSAIHTWKQAWGYGHFFGLMVYPISKMVNGLKKALPEWAGWGTIIAIIIAVIVTRLISLAITFKSTMMQSVQESLKSKKAAIEAKYIGFEKNKAMKMKKNQEIQALYAKYNINPMDSFAGVLVSMPIFFSMWRAIQSSPYIKATEWLGLNFASQSFSKVLSGEWIYLWILVVTILVQLFSQLLPQLLQRKKNKITMTVTEAQALKKSEKTQKIFMLVFTGITIMFSVGVQVYWLFGGLWQIFQVLAIHKLKKTKWFKQKYSTKLMKKS
ncbi:membrane protein insertase YidC [Mycoplasma leonicaptivi]|uniref:membrane protein insertase YidC n=1 Tax=Mycoplasma leonicaptivi TaxID=36742 RepID=UPI000A5019DA|nr:membrane protein insertase YidC [Mycoplasma leonicaptivi]